MRSRASSFAEFVDVVGRFPKTANQKTITKAVWISMPLGAMSLSAQLYAMEAELWKDAFFSQKCQKFDC